MNLSFFIARRITRSDAGRKAGVMERIAVLSVALSIAVMILSLAVMFGFKREVSHKMTAFAAHVTVEHVRGSGLPIRRSVELERLLASLPGFRSLSPFAVKEGIVRTDDVVEGVLLKGVDSTCNRRLFGEWLVEGRLPAVGGAVRTKDILISSALADRLMLGVGDRVGMLFVDGGATPRRDRFKVSGIYSSGMDEMDRALVVTDIRNVQRLCDMTEDQVSGYDVDLDDESLAPRYADEVNGQLLFAESDDAADVRAVDVFGKYPNIFDWLKAHDVNSAVILVIMLVVSFFNMAVVLLVLVLERTRMIGLLKALGMRNGALRAIFLFRAAFVALKGLLLGNVAGVSLALLQKGFHIVKLSSEGYLLSEVPIALDAGWWALLNLGFIVSIVLLLLLPASIVATVKPEETIKYE